MTRGSGLIRALALFGATLIASLLLVGWLLTLYFRAPADAAAIVAAGWVAVGVQMLTFSVMRLVGREQVLVAWGLGVLVRFAVVALWALVLVPALGLSATPALIGLVAFFFVSTVVEPIFLNI